MSTILNVNGIKEEEAMEEERLSLSEAIPRLRDNSISSLTLSVLFSILNYFFFFLNLNNENNIIIIIITTMIIINENNNNNINNKYA